MAYETLKKLFPKPILHINLSPGELIQQTLESGNGKIADTGALAINTGTFTGRSPKDKYIVEDAIARTSVNWNDFNHPISEKYFNLLHADILKYLNGKKEIWARHSYACADPAYRIKIRVVTEEPWANLFAYNLFLRPEKEELETFRPEWQILQAPGFHADPTRHGTRAKNFTIVSFTQKTILIGGSAYTGEIKKGIFSVLNFLLPHNHGMLGMHCSANIGEKGDTTLFFGLSGTGKTTLSADPKRKLIGDDEHGWSEAGIFNFEGGCYAKVVNLSEEYEPEIFKAIRPGALLENVVFHKDSDKVDYSDISITENTRVSYPLSFIKNAVTPSVGGIPKNIFFLTCDAYGVFPPISRLTPEQAKYYFISGYTAKIAGTEEGIKEPTATFSACFGAPFLPLNPLQYAEILEDKIEQHQVKVWLVNTGWSGGGYGVGQRIKLAYTRAMVNAALEGNLDEVSYTTTETLGLSIPQECPGVPTKMLNPSNTWADLSTYNEALKKLCALFDSNNKKYQSKVTLTSQK